jgi:hypothetical protein
MRGEIAFVGSPDSGVTRAVAHARERNQGIKDNLDVEAKTRIDSL